MKMFYLTKQIRAEKYFSILINLAGLPEVKRAVKLEVTSQ